MANEAPVLVEDINLPQAFISEASFVLPRVYANKYDENGVNKVPCTVRVEYERQDGNIRQQAKALCLTSQINGRQHQCYVPVRRYGIVQ